MTLSAAEVRKDTGLNREQSWVRYQRGLTLEGSEEQVAVGFLAGKTRSPSLLLLMFSAPSLLPGNIGMIGNFVL